MTPSATLMVAMLFLIPFTISDTENKKLIYSLFTLEVSIFIVSLLVVGFGMGYILFR